MSQLDKGFNKTIEQSVPAASVVGGMWMANEIESTQDNPIHLYDASFGVGPSVAADLAILPSVHLYIIKNFRIADISLAATLIVGAFGSGQIIHHSIQNTFGTKQTDWWKGFKLEPGFIYTVFMYVEVASAAYTAPVTFTLSVHGDMLPMFELEEAPIRPRMGTDSETPKEVESICL